MQVHRETWDAFEKVRIVTRMQTAAASLVAAIPAGILAALLAMMFMTQLDSMKPMVMVAAGGSLLAAAVVVLMPFGILLFSGKSAAKAAPKAADKKAVAKGDDDEAELSADEGYVAESEVEETVEFRGDSSSEVMAFDDDDLEPTDEDLFDEEEEVKPKKKGKKK